jgi:hypothetical protein
MALIKQMKKKSAYDSFLIITSNQLFFDSKKIDDLIAYENNTQKRLDNLRIETICIYELNGMQPLSIGQIISLLSAHEYVVHREGRYEILDSSKVVELIRHAMDRGIMGAGSGNLLTKTLKLMYKIDEKSIVNDPIGFELTVKKVLGHQSDKILNEIGREMLKEMEF